MSRTDQVAGDLIDALQNGDDLDAAWRKHSYSKSVLYAAAGDALVWAKQQLETLGEDLPAAFQRRNEVAAEVQASTEEHGAEAGHAVQHGDLQGVGAKFRCFLSRFFWTDAYGLHTGNDHLVVVE